MRRESISYQNLRDLNGAIQARNKLGKCEPYNLRHAKDAAGVHGFCDTLRIIGYPMQSDDSSRNQPVADDELDNLIAGLTAREAGRTSR